MSSLETKSYYTEAEYVAFLKKRGTFDKDDILILPYHEKVLQMWRAHRISRKASLGRLLLKTSRRNPCSHNSSHLANASSQTNSSNINNVLASHFSTRTHVITGDCKNQDHALETGEEELFRRERKLQHPGASGADGFRHLFNTLGIISAGVPRQLVDVTSKTTVAENHWRNADVFKGYRDGSFHNWKSSNNQKTSSVAAAAISLSDPDEEDQDYDLDEQETISFQQQRKRHQVDSSWEKGEDLLGDIQIGEDCDEEYSDQASKAAATVESQDLSLSDEEFDERSIMTAVEQQLSETIRKRHVDDAIQLFEIGTVQHGLEISMDIVDDLYRLMTYHRPFHSYQLLQYILRRTNTDIQASSRYDDKEDEKSIEESQRIGKLYRRMCFSLRLLDPIKSRHGDIRSLVSSVVSDLREMNEHVERLCLPVLVTSLAEQRSSNIGRWAFRYYQRMAEKNYELRPEYFQHLLTLSKFNRQDNLPYHDILQQVVQAGRRPLPHIVMNALENMFPYTDNVQGTYIALQSVMELQRQSQQMAQEQQQQRELDVAQLAQEQDPEEIEKIKKRMSLYRKPRSYVVDIATLESMNVAAARTGCAELALLLWDALDIMGYEPTESIYESTIVCFAKDDNLCENAFVVLKEMEDKGFVPSRALIKSFSMALR